jgi:hypothetical protein
MFLSGTGQVKGFHQKSLRPNNPKLYPEDFAYGS